MLAVSSPGEETDESGRTLGDFFAEIGAAGGPALSTEDHRAMTAAIRADRGTLTISK